MAMAFDFKKNAKEYALIAAAGAFVAVWMGFGNFGWMRGSTAEALAKKESAVAVNAAYARICDAQFRAAPKFEERLAALQKAERYSRGDVIVKAGFANIPSVKEPSRDVGQACADILIPEKPAGT
jgi:hypothetical protein